MNVSAGKMQIVLVGYGKALHVAHGHYVSQGERNVRNASEKRTGSKPKWFFTESISQMLSMVSRESSSLVMAGTCLPKIPAMEPTMPINGSDNLVALTGMCTTGFFIARASIIPARISLYVSCSGPPNE